MSRFYITNAIAYVNGDPHLGHALEFVQTDVLARHRRLRGDDVRYLSGTDENALKNVQAAAAAGLAPAQFVATRSDLFERLRDPLALSYDDFIRTSADPRHRPGVERLWRACADAGDLELRAYTGRYCGGCEAFLDDDDLADGVCPEHGTPPEPVEERNWFFRLSRHAGPLADAIESGALAIAPEHRRNEVLAVLRSGLADLSVSRPRERAGGWGIPVPGDPGQVIYVWFDALANYVTALGYGNGGGDYARWWADGGERVHVVGKGITRFHALYWPAILRSAGEPLPTRVLVHDYVTVGGRKLSKSLGNAVDPAALAERYGTDALRWWVVRDVPRSGDADFREDGLARRANELADGLGNLVSRTVSLAARAGATPSNWHPPRVPIDRIADPGLAAAIDAVPASIDAALGRFDLRAAADAVWSSVEAANRFVSARRPWQLEGEARAAVLADALAACAAIAVEIAPFLPGGSGRIVAALESGDPAAARRLFPKAA
ncbi:MAG TPA: methionine--tRNA ligase [Gaiellales bacterium]|jgi:methionyl-tRNA synthetase|nr:methionine--tRNA ligase [Gaiellales bacterium]